VTLSRLTPRLTSLKRIILFLLPTRQPTTSSSPSSDLEGGIPVRINSVDSSDPSSFIQFNHDPFDKDDITGGGEDATSRHSADHLHTGSSLPSVSVPVPAPIALSRALPARFPPSCTLGAMLPHLHACEVMLSMSPRAFRNLLRMVTLASFHRRVNCVCGRLCATDLVLSHCRLIMTYVNSR
jgi:hypothetical protein